MSQSKRKPWPDYFMDIAQDVATRATCDRKHVGAVIVLNNRILSTGYNGSIPGAPHCDDVGHMMEDGHCVRTVHAESNAILQAAKHGVAVAGATIYTTASPCWPCFQKIVSAGLTKIVFGELYRDDRIREFALSAGIELVGPLRPQHRGSDERVSTHHEKDHGQGVAQTTPQIAEVDAGGTTSAEEG